MNKIIIAAAAVLLAGCDSLPQTVNELRDDDYSVGCATSEAQLGVGGYGQKGEVVACKLKCSKEKLPDGYKMRYNNPRTGCSASVGYSNTEKPDINPMYEPQDKYMSSEQFD